jgi:sulfur-oxidizing protein SoxY
VRERGVTNQVRRLILKAVLAATAVAAGLIEPLRAVAGEWNKAAFDAREIRLALKAAGVANAVASADLIIRAPEIAENGAQVPIEVVSKIPGTRVLYLFVDKNPQPFVGSFEFLEGAEPFISTRIKMGETSNVRAVARAGSNLYIALCEVKVTIGGCAT